MRAAQLPHLALLLTLATGPVLAQNTSQNPAQGTPDRPEQLSNQEQAERRIHQRTERIHIEDAGSSVDELRVGGETRSITVQPKNGSAAYEVQPTDGVRNRAGKTSPGEGSTGSRVWNVMKF